MKIVIISDNHLARGLEKALKHEQADFAIHCGDSQMAEDSSELQGFQVKVKGNCDYSSFPRDEIVHLNNSYWFVCHGHQVGYSPGAEGLADLAKVNGCQVICSGHTHVPMYAKYDDIILLNPGSFSRSRASTPASYLAIEIEDNNWRVFLKRADNFRVIKELVL